MDERTLYNLALTIARLYDSQLGENSTQTWNVYTFLDQYSPDISDLYHKIKDEILIPEEAIWQYVDWNRFGNEITRMLFGYNADLSQYRKFIRQVNDTITEWLVTYYKAKY